ncbi:MAG TPA: phosphotransferase, partial [Thermomicrobiales bacterium]|nr:phosphotransferase [Thermomicrobiales bacterium]
MSELPSDTLINALAQRVRPASTVLRAWRLEGGVSAQVTAVELALPDGHTERIVVRRHGEIDKGHNPDIARHEFRLLSLLHSSGMEVPAPLYVDQTEELFGEPCLVVEFVDGSTEIPPEAVPDATERMAVFLARLHELDLDRQA